MKRSALAAAFLILLIGSDGIAQSVNAKEEYFKALKGQQASPLTTLQAQVKGTFWRNPEWIARLNLSADQQKKMDDAFQQYRLKLIDLTAALEKEELVLQPLIGRTRPTPQDEPRILTQIERVANARAELEKANGRMLMDVLLTLTPEQWSNLPFTSKKLFFKSVVK